MLRYLREGKELGSEESTCEERKEDSGIVLTNAHKRSLFTTPYYSSTLTAHSTPRSRLTKT
ncbi:hypothetical protein E2C01_024767 [Portunus trituberculatus]|uniref:Uncharacterized protein n=1 Tax=Portunus trituberculatus TaxID=210409 RepID=A0A5B7EDS9_PORTR|nr:hypothetical protein [Portunus trituberculatus]